MVLEGISQVENYLQLILAKSMNMSIIPWVDFGFSILLGLDLRSGFIAGFSTDHYFCDHPRLVPPKSKAEKQYAHFNYCPTTLLIHYVESTP